LHEKIHTVTTTAANVLGDSSKFPGDWLFSYRWGKSRTRGKKGDKESNVLPNGEKIIHITVGGRTSAVVESRQKKIKGDNEEPDEDVKEKSVKGKVSKNGAVTEKRKAKEEIKKEEVTPKKRRASGK
jgi:formamidopyrimidine-DNA glycosylase